MSVESACLLEPSRRHVQDEVGGTDHDQPLYSTPHAGKKL